LSDERKALCFGFFMMSKAEQEMAAQSVPVAPGEQTFTIHVTVSFAIVDSK